MLCVAAATTALIMECMSVVVADDSSACIVADATAAANAVSVVTIDYSVAFLKDIYDRSCGGSIQG